VESLTLNNLLLNLKHIHLLLLQRKRRMDRSRAPRRKGVKDNYRMPQKMVLPGTENHEE
jgi:hypothetical protein